MPPTRCVALAFDPHRLDRQQGLLLAGIRRFAERAPQWRCVFDPAATRRLRGRYHGLLAPGDVYTGPACAQAGVPAILVTLRGYERTAATFVAEHRRTAGRLAAEHLHRRGYRSFAHVGVSHYTPSGLERGKFRRWLRERRLSAATRHYSRRRDRTTRQWESDLDGIRHWLDALPKPVGIFCTLDAMARTLAHIADSRGLRVPQDIGLIGGGNDVSLCELAEPALTSIEYHYEAVGHRAAELLDRLMDGEPRPRRNILIPPILVPRRSTDFPGYGDPCVARALDYIAAHLADPIRAADVAAASGLSHRHLLRRLRDRRNRTIAQEILGARLAAARRLLATTPHSITAIARRTGFTSRRALTAAFRQHFGISPTILRARAPVEPSWPPREP